VNSYPYNSLIAEVQRSVALGLDSQTSPTTDHHLMDNPNPTSSRPTLKLKTGARRPTEPNKAFAPQQGKKDKLKPGAHWSDEYKERMQADMDALASR
jgi:hypothetical protein